MVLRTAVLVAVLLAGGAAAPESDVNGPANQAFVDPAATKDMAGQVKAGLEAVLSYTWSDTDSWRRAVQTYTTGDAKRQLQGRLDTTLPTIAQQQATATTTVVALGVRDQRGDHGELLAFLNTSSTTQGRSTTITASSVVVSAQHGARGWQLSDLQVRR
jgi:Mce-associated membrane protein